MVDGEDNMVFSELGKEEVKFNKQILFEDILVIVDGRGRRYEETV